ncbi:NERD domain-containing protein [Candidatus Woesearchaeota archaeon]|nr:NERD domain-containing protein [Candidatus Woesearchaeota archaeon]
MIIHGIPGSLVELLKPVRHKAEQRGLFPHDYKALEHMGDIGRVVERMKRLYEGESFPLSNHILDYGIIAENRFIEDIKYYLRNQEGHLFNNAEISCQDEGFSGVGLTVHPDHLLVMPQVFFYIETKNWTPAYLNRKGKREGVKAQMDHTKTIMRSAFPADIPVPRAFLYDHRGSFQRQLDGYEVIESPRALLDIIVQEINTPRLPYYEKLITVLDHDLYHKKEK